MKPEQRTVLWRVFFLVAALEAGAVSVASALQLGGGQLSVARVGGIAFLLICAVASGVAALRLPSWLFVQPRPVLIGLVAASSTTLALFLFLLRFLDPPRFLPYYERVAAPLGYGLAVTVQALVVLLVSRFGFSLDMLVVRGTFLKSAAVVFSILMGAFLFVAVTRLGLTPDPAYWGEPGVPLLGWQLGLILMLGLVAVVFVPGAGNAHRRDLILGVGLWLAAIIVWSSVPAETLRNSFYAPMRPPTDQPFPNSDAGYYDVMAQSLLIGHPYLGEIPTRPLYIVLLTALHVILGENYGLIGAGQILLLGLIPVLMYLIGSTLHSPQAGLMAGFASLFREWTTLTISSSTRVSNSRMLLVDLPTLFLLLLSCFLMIRWLQSRSFGRAMISGAVFGLLLLLRTQSLLVLPIILVVSLLALGVKRASSTRQVAAFLGAVVLALSPWIAHNYVRTGQLTMDAQFQYRVIASQYRYTGNLDIENIDLEGKSPLAMLVTFAVKDPAFVLGFIANHSMATQVSALMALPLIYRYDGLMAPLNLYWVNWDGYLSPANVTLAIFYLALIACGIASALRHGWIGLVPLAFSVAYSLANGVGRFSGWRYDLPADWTGYFYLVLGVAEIFTLLRRAFGRRDDRAVAATAPPSAQLERPGRTVVVVGLLILAGASPWLAELMARPRFSVPNRAALVSELSTSPAVLALGISSGQLQSFSGQASAEVQFGRVLYPRFFTRNLGLASTHPWPAYAPRDFPRLAFIMLNTSRLDVVLPSRQIPEGIDHGDDAILLSCDRGDYLEARLIYMPSSDLAYMSMPLTDPCP